jgi:hypothetical protein
MARTIQYVPSFQSPLNWREWDGETQQAILHYFDPLQRQIMTARQIEQMRVYLAHYIDAPCWQATNIKMCRDAGLDPL